ncbi:MAG: C40 family peptidase [Lachnospiraceae bacterium]|nr:C40 family peptidase [Lachnospiraceae bacterium]
MEQNLIWKPVVQIRQKPSVDSMVTDEIFYGMEVTVHKALYNGWLKICTYYGYEGYIRQDDIVCTEVGRERRELVRSGFADVYVSPDVKAGVMLTLVRGSIVTILIRESNGYTEVQLLDGRIGYIKTSQLAPYEEHLLIKNEKQLRRQLVDNAMAYLGTPYRYGGKTPVGIDCSGLTFMAYFLSGVIIYRDSKMEPEYPVHEIEKRNLLPGDLIYFPGHVALYLGEQRFIHATDKLGIEKVAVQSMNPEDEEYRKDLAEGVLQYGSIF